MPLRKLIMLYCKVDSFGRPLEAPKNYKQIEPEFISQNILVTPKGFENTYIDCEQPTYQRVPPTQEPLPAIEAGEKIVPDIPNLNSDGSLERKWKVVKCNEEDRDLMSRMLISRRNELVQENIDIIPQMKWDLFSDEVKQVYIDYYNALMSIESNPTFPYLALPVVPAIILHHRFMRETNELIRVP